MNFSSSSSSSSSSFTVGELVGGWEEDGAHRIHVLNMEGSIATDDFIWADDVLVAREGGPTGTGDSWQNFDLVAINANGNYMFTGDSSGPFASDEFIAYNGEVVVREGERRLCHRRTPSPRTR